MRKCAPYCTLQRSLVRVKDPTPAQQRTGIVYRIPCGNCPKVYIGKTSRTLKHRHTDYKTACVLPVIQHMMEDAQTIQWEDVEVVNHNLQYFQRCTLKACHIQTKQHKMTALFGNVQCCHSPVTPTRTLLIIDYPTACVWPHYVHT